MLYGDNEYQPSQEAIEELTGIAASLHLAPKLVTAVPFLGFEARKDASQVVNCGVIASFYGRTLSSGLSPWFKLRFQVFSGIVRTKIKDRYLVAESILAERGGNMLTELIGGYETTDFALNYGVMLRECVRVPSLAR